MPTQKGLQVLDTIDESKMATAGIRISSSNGFADVTTKKDQSSPCQIFLYRVVPKK